MFSASATHALRAVAWIAAHDGDDAILGRNLAKEIAVPAHYLSKVLATLARGGVLTASRGVKGGYRLARPASRIKLVDVVLPFEGKRARPGCLLQPHRRCRVSAPCSAHGSWSSVKQSYIDFLEKTTVKDIQGGG
jgi:Rrf2 family protein